MSSHSWGPHSLVSGRLGKAGVGPARSRRWRAPVAPISSTGSSASSECSEVGTAGGSFDSGLHSAAA